MPISEKQIKQCANSSNREDSIPTKLQSNSEIYFSYASPESCIHEHSVIQFVKLFSSISSTAKWSFFNKILFPALCLWWNHIFSGSIRKIIIKKMSGLPSNLQETPLGAVRWREQTHWKETEEQREKKLCLVLWASRWCSFQKVSLWNFPPFLHTKSLPVSPPPCHSR